MGYEPDITTTDILDAVTELGGQVGAVATAVAELGKQMHAELEGLGTSLAGLDACVAKLDVVVRQVRTGLATGTEGEAK